MKQIPTGWTCALVALAVSAGATAQDGSAEPLPPGGPYTLTNPKPEHMWRPLSADRPDLTESPISVDAGAVQVEMSFVEYAWDGGSNALAVAPFNLKLGLTEQADIQFVWTPYVRESNGSTVDGVGDTQIRLKINVWGNDAAEGRESAFAIMPFIKIPTASDGLGNGRVEGGLIFPYGTDLTENIGLGLMLETDFVYDDAEDNYDVDFVHTGVLGFALGDAAGAYLELVGIASTDSDIDYRALLGLGGTYGVNENLVLDAGVNIGLTDDVDDVVVFGGMTVRF